MWSTQDPIPSTGGKHYPQRVPPRREETDLHIGLANLSVLYQEDLIPKTYGFGNQWKLTFVSQRAVRNQDSSLKYAFKRSLALSPSTEMVAWKELGSGQLTHVREPPRVSSPGTGRIHFCDLILLCWHQHLWVPFWNLPSNLLVPGACSIQLHAHSHLTPPGLLVSHARGLLPPAHPEKLHKVWSHSQPDLKSALDPRAPTALSLAKIKSSCSLHRKYPWNIWLWCPRGVCCLAPKNFSSIRLILQNLEM